MNGQALAAVLTIALVGALSWRAAAVAAIVRRAKTTMGGSPRANTRARPPSGETPAIDDRVDAAGASSPHPARAPRSHEEGAGGGDDTPRQLLARLGWGFACGAALLAAHPQPSLGGLALGVAFGLVFNALDRVAGDVIAAARGESARGATTPRDRHEAPARARGYAAIAAALAGASLLSMGLWSLPLPLIDGGRALADHAGGAWSGLAGLIALGTGLLAVSAAFRQIGPRAARAWLPWAVLATLVAAPVIPALAKGASVAALATFDGFGGQWLTPILAALATIDWARDPNNRASVNDRGADGPATTAARWLAPVVGVLTLALIDAGHDQGATLHATASGAPAFVPTDLPQRRGLAPDIHAGQLIILPEDTPLESGRTYALRLRADPRGHKLGVLDKKEDLVWISGWQIAEGTTYVWFRPRDERLGALPGFDIWVPVTAEAIVAGGARAIALRPTEPQMELRKLATRMQGPYVPLSDMVFEGSVLDAQSAEFGGHKALFERRDPDSAPNPILRELVSELRFAGPFLDAELEPEIASAPFGRSPRALLAIEELAAPIGSTIRLRFSPPARGLPIAEVRPIQAELRAPAWRVLLGVRTAILLHDTDPTLDVTFPVESSVGPDGTVRFRSLREDIVDLSRFAELTEHHSVALRVPAIDVEFEVHGDARLPAGLAGRRVLVPRSAVPELVRPPSRDLYDPHPMELLAAGMRPPVLAYDGVAAATFDMSGRSGTLPAAAWLVALAAVAALGISTALEAALRQFEASLGRAAGVGAILTGLVCLAALAVGGVALQVAPEAAAVLGCLALAAITLARDHAPRW